MTVVLCGLPADLPVAVVVQQHLSVQGSALADVLRQRTGYDIVWATDGAPLVPGQVAVCPPRMRLEVLPDGTCSLIEPHDSTCCAP